ncbi:MAG: hypothetical protein WAK19_03550, partial [Candidatus Cybelea sp.]
VGLSTIDSSVKHGLMYQSENRPVAGGAITTDPRVVKEASCYRITSQFCYIVQVSEHVSHGVCEWYVRIAVKGRHSRTHDR